MSTIATNHPKRVFLNNNNNNRMAQLTLSTGAKATMRANLELERKSISLPSTEYQILTPCKVKNRREKLLSMVEAQVSSLKSRLERRVNRVPLRQRKTAMSTYTQAQSQQSTRSAPVPKMVAPVLKSGTAPKGSRKPIPTMTVVAPIKSTRPAFNTMPAKIQYKPTAPAKKRTSDEISDNKENGGDLQVPKKRAKTANAAPAPSRPVRATRAASKKITAPAQILSPKTVNTAPVPKTRTRRPR